MPQLSSLQLFKNLSDETRLGIVLLLREMGELCVCDLCTVLDQSQPKISRHLAMLRESGLLLDRKQGKWVHYRLSPHIPSWAAQVIEQAWLSQQADTGHHAEDKTKHRHQRIPRRAVLQRRERLPGLQMTAAENEVRRADADPHRHHRKARNRRERDKHRVRGHDA
mgnify:CR=1 FL=1